VYNLSSTSSSTGPITKIQSINNNNNKIIIIIIIISIIIMHMFDEDFCQMPNSNKTDSDDNKFD